MSRRSSRALRYVPGFSCGAVGVSLALWFMVLGLSTLWSQHKTERLTVTYSPGHIQPRDSDVPAPSSRYTNTYDFGRVGDEREEVKNRNVTV